MREIFYTTAAAIGTAVLAVVAVLVVAWVVFVAVPYLFGQMCYVGFSVMASKAQKEEARKLGRFHAEQEQLRTRERELSATYDRGVSDGKKAATAKGWP